MIKIQDTTKPAPPQWNNIPNELKELDRWVGYKLVWDVEKQKFNKPPFSLDGKQNQGFDTHYTFEKVKNAVDAGLVDGAGFAMTDKDNLICIDLDGDSLEDIPKGLMDISKHSYAELSPSGNGIHVWFKGDKPEGGGNKQNRYTKNEGYKVECFYSTGFLTVTGNAINDLPIEENQIMLNYIYDNTEHSSEKETDISFVDIPIPENEKKDGEVLAKMFNSNSGEKIKGLFNGDTSFYNNDSSAADIALSNYLAIHTQCNAEQMDRIFRTTELYRDKWDSKRGNSTYGMNTIRKSIEWAYPKIQQKDFGIKIDFSEEKRNDVRMVSVMKIGDKTPFVINKDGTIKKTLSNLRLMILKQPQINGIGFDEFAQEVTVDKQPITNEYIADLRLAIDTKNHITFTEGDILQMVSSIAREVNSYHPIKQIVESKPWDEVTRAENIFIDYLGADDNAYSKVVARKWLTGAVARIYEPGIKMEIVPVLQGKQGVGKSTLASKLGGEFFVDSLASMGKNKDDYQLLIGSWIIELAELSSFNSTDAEQMKSFISARFDKIRLPYAVIPQKYQRTSVFIGTTNNSQFLKDLTGNRRFFPIPLTNKAKSDIFALDNETIQQIWAESFSMYKDGEKLFIDNEEDLEAAEAYRDQATEESLFFMKIDDYLEMKVPEHWDSINIDTQKYKFDSFQRGQTAPGTWTLHKTTAKEIAYMLELDPKDRNSNSQMKRIKLYMDNLEGWESKTVKIKGRSQRGYMRKK